MDDNLFLEIILNYLNQKGVLSDLEKVTGTFGVKVTGTQGPKVTGTFRVKVTGTQTAAAGGTKK